MCGSVAQAQQKPVYVAPHCPAPAPAPPPKSSCAPVVDTFTPPPVVRPESPVVQSAPSSCTPAPAQDAAPQAATCAPERKGFGGLLRAMFTAVLTIVAAFLSAQPARVERHNDRDADRTRCDWRSFEGNRRAQTCAPAVEQDAPRRIERPVAAQIRC